MIDTEAFKKRLEEELNRVTKELQELGIHNPEVSQDWIATPDDVNTSEADQNVIADRTEAWGEKQAETEPLETEYNNVTRALQKIENGTFGTCEVCGNAIEADRLDAYPAARTCKTHMNDESTLATA